ncbi:MAG TPA: hypothetical protein PLD54_01735 [Candidatus Levybacteria bacterium]|nr:hypothetical protein [Candidatus Levybacteria bacterium]
MQDMYPIIVFVVMPFLSMVVLILTYIALNSKLITRLSILKRIVACLLGIGVIIYLSFIANYVKDEVIYDSSGFGLGFYFLPFVIFIVLILFIAPILLCMRLLSKRILEQKKQNS